MPAPHFPGNAWRTSSFSGANSNCVEVVRTPAAVAARDSKNPAGPRLLLSPAAWDRLVHHVTG